METGDHHIRLSGLALASLILSILYAVLGLCVAALTMGFAIAQYVTALVVLLFAVLGLRECIHTPRLFGKGLAIAATIIACAWLATFIVIFAIPFAHHATEAYDVQEPYTDTEYYTESVPYQTQEPYTTQQPHEETEYYTEWISSSNCDRDSQCRCQHTSFLGLGSCDSCACTRTRTVTKFRDVTAYRTVTGYRQEQRTRPVTKYRTVQHERDAVKSDTLYMQWTGRGTWWYKA